jgi:hypothetical protein
VLAELDRDRLTLREHRARIQRSGVGPRKSLPFSICGEADRVGPRRGRDRF